MTIDIPSLPQGYFIVDELYMESKSLFMNVTIKGILYPPFDDKPVPEVSDMVTTYDRNMEE